MAERKLTLKPRMVLDVWYRCRDIGHGVEEGTFEGFWTGEIDAWGKRTFRPVDGSGPLYLFSDEIVEAH